jgi:hypothetical protein
VTSRRRVKAFSVAFGITIMLLTGRRSKQKNTSGKGDILLFGKMGKASSWGVDDVMMGGEREQGSGVARAACHFPILGPSCLPTFRGGVPEVVGCGRNKRAQATVADRHQSWCFASSSSCEGKGKYSSDLLSPTK